MGGNTVVKGKNIIIATGSDVKSLPRILYTNREHELVIHS
jgi:pyruvate/2-oxoglutarate dehydrogenase complex dihydrolipoamide dehydrogenase (E3) component